MPLQIIEGNAPLPVAHLVALIYGQPGAWKSSLAFTSSNPVCLDFDYGAHRSQFRKKIVRVDNWAELDELDRDFYEPHDTIIIDTVGRALDLLSLRLLEEDPKNGRGGGALSLQGYGNLKVRFAKYLTLMRSYGKDVVLVAHDKEDKRGDDLIMRPDMQGGSYQEVFKLSDAVGYVYVARRKHILDFEPNDAFVAKNPAALQAVELPHFDQVPDFLAKVLAKMKDAMGQLSAESAEVAAQLQAWCDKVDKAVPGHQAARDPEDLAEGEHLKGDPAAMNALLDELATMKDNRSLHLQARHVLWQAGKAAALEFDKAAGKYTVPKPKKATKKKASKKAEAPAPESGNGDQAPAEGEAPAAEQQGTAEGDPAVEPQQSGDLPLDEAAAQE